MIRACSALFPFDNTISSFSVLNGARQRRDMGKKVGLDRVRIRAYSSDFEG